MNWGATGRRQKKPKKQKRRFGCISVKLSAWIAGQLRASYLAAAEPAPRLILSGQRKAAYPHAPRARVTLWYKRITINADIKPSRVGKLS